MMKNGLYYRVDSRFFLWYFIYNEWDKKSNNGTKSVQARRPVMQDIIKLQKKIVPEITELLERRYSILKSVYYNQPVGRRTISEELNIGERIVRAEVNFLKDQSLIEIKTGGMITTKQGEEVLEKLKKFIFELRGLSDVEKYIKDKLDLKDLIIVPGDIDSDTAAYADLGRAAAGYVKGILKDGYIVALTGGTTIKGVVDNFPKMTGMGNTIVVPARGGVGKNVETQSNTLAAKLADKIGASYKLLQVLDNLSKRAMNALVKEKEVKEVLDVLQKTDLLIHGIGKMQAMASRRGLSEEEIQNLLNIGAVGEAFGYYFDKQGKIVHSTQTAGIKYDEVKKIKTQVAVAGGSHKAEAILSVIKNNNKTVLVTDEGAAKEILNLLKNETI
jgi:central glycolytic genes regulator